MSVKRRGANVGGRRTVGDDGGRGFSNYGNGPEARTMTEIQRRRLPQVTTSKFQTLEVSGSGILVTRSGQKVYSSFVVGESLRVPSQGKTLTHPS